MPRREDSCVVRRWLATLVVMLTAWPAAPVRADAPTTLDGLLALPPSPGIELLLLPHAADARVAQRWRDALADADPERRAAAARMIGAAAVRTAIGALTAAAANEQDAVARAEMLRALVVIGSDTTDRMVLAHLDRLSPAAAKHVVRTIATLRPATAAAFLIEGGVLGEAQPIASERAVELVARLLRVAPDQAARLETETDRLAPGTLQGLLHHAHSTAHVVPPPLVLAALRADAHTAGEALSYLPEAHGRPNAIAPDHPLAAAYRVWREQPSDTTDPTHAFVLGIADRWLGRTPAAPLSAMRPDRRVLEQLQLPMTALAVLSRDERRALTRQLEWKGDIAKALQHADFTAPATPWGWESRQRGARLLSDLPGAIVVDVVRLTGCQSGAFATDRGVVATYRDDGRPRQVSFSAPDLDAACKRVAILVASSSYGDASLPGDEPSVTLLRLQPEYVSCLRTRDQDLRVPAGTQPAGPLPITPPRKVKDERPIYPKAAQSARVQGVVIIEAYVTRSGCVAEARVTRQIPGLDVSALQAVSYWRYSPTLLGDTPTPTIMTVTVNFKLD